MSKQRASVRSLVESVISEPDAGGGSVIDEEQATGGLPGMADMGSSSPDTVIPTAKFESVEPLVATAPAPAPAPAAHVVPVAVIADPYLAWLQSPQGQKLRHLGGVNMDRLHHAYADRVEAIFKAGYAAGLGDSI